MSKDSTTGEHVCSCDYCDTDAYGGTLEFREFWEDIKRQGWRCFKDENDGVWKHKCPECVRA